MSRIVNHKARYKIELGNGEYIEVKSQIAFTDLGQFIGAGEGGAAANYEKSVKFLEFAIMDWHLLDEDNAPVPFAKERIQDLDVDTVNTVILELYKRYGLDKKKGTPSIES